MNLYNKNLVSNTCYLLYNDSIYYQTVLSLINIKVYEICIISIYIFKNWPQKHYQTHQVHKFIQSECDIYFVHNIVTFFFLINKKCIYIF